MQIPSRFNGPPGSGNGGWSAGAFARASGLGGVVEVTLRVPPPLDTDLAYAGDAFRTADGTLVASVRAAADVGDPVPPVPPDEAAAASAAYPGFSTHPFPTCYVCGPERADGLRVFPGPLPDGRNAAPWTVPDDISAETVWAALDCPGGWSALHSGRTRCPRRAPAAWWSAGPTRRPAARPSPARPSTHRTARRWRRRGAHGSRSLR
jgi:hypothetical protein